MKRLSLLRGLVFALIAGLGVMFWLQIAGPSVGYARATALYGLGLLPCYALTVAPVLRRGVVACALSVALVAPVAVMEPGSRLVFALTPFILGIVRSAVLFPRPFARALFLELCVSGLALLLAAFFHDASVVGVTFAVWVFWLVQAGFALAPGEAQAAQQDADDAFEVARARALAVLERGVARGEQARRSV
jgi:predicted membrane metal-binding protein